MLASGPATAARSTLNPSLHACVRALWQQVALPGPDVARWQQESQLVVQCSSLGSLDKAFLDVEFNGSLSAARPPPGTMAIMAASHLVLPHRLHLVWPTVQVRAWMGCRCCVVPAGRHDVRGSWFG